VRLVPEDLILCVTTRRQEDKSLIYNELTTHKILHNMGLYIVTSYLACLSRCDLSADRQAQTGQRTKNVLIVTFFGKNNNYFLQFLLLF